MTGHEQQMEGYADIIGIAALRRLLPVSVERIHKALARGDKHLNSIPLELWDKAAGVDNPERSRTGKFDMAYGEVFTSANSRGLSLSIRVSILKHVAKYHTALNPPQEDGADETT